MDSSLPPLQQPDDVGRKYGQGQRRQQPHQHGRGEQQVEEIDQPRFDALGAGGRNDHLQSGRDDGLGEVEVALPIRGDRDIAGTEIGTAFFDRREHSRDVAAVDVGVAPSGSLGDLIEQVDREAVLDGALGDDEGFDIVGGYGDVAFGGVGLGDQSGQSADCDDQKNRDNRGPYT